MSATALAGEVQLYGSTWDKKLALAILAILAGQNGGTAGGPTELVWVDPVNGVDATAAAGDITKPAQTLGKAFQLASGVGAPAAILAAPGTYTESVAINVATRPLVGVRLSFLGPATWHEASGAPQLAITCAAAGDNASAQAVQITGPVTFQRADNGIAVHVTGHATTPGGTPAFAPGAPFVVGPDVRFLNCGHICETIDSVEHHATATGALPAGGSSFLTCNSVLFDGAYPDLVNLGYDGSIVVGNGRRVHTFNGPVATLAITGAPNLQTGALWSGTIDGTTGLLCYAAGSVDIAPRVSHRAGVCGQGVVNMPAEAGFAHPFFEAPGLLLTGVYTLSKAGSTVMAASVQGSYAFATATGWSIGAKVAAQAQGWGGTQAQLATTSDGTIGGVPVRLSGRSVSTSSTPVTLPFTFPNGLYAVTIEHNAALQDVWVSAAKTGAGFEAQAAAGAFFDFVVTPS